MAVDEWRSQMQQRVIELVKADELTDYQLTDYQRDVLIELLELELCLKVVDEVK